MGIFSDIFSGTDDADERIKLRMQNQELQEEIGYLDASVRDLQEDMLKISDAFDRRGTAEIGVSEVDATEITLATVKKVAKLARALNTMNPFVKRGVEARMGYIWGKGVSFDGVNGVTEEMTKNRRVLFSPQAYEELERVLATDGNAFTALSNSDAPAFRVPLDQIVGCVSNPLNREEIWYYKRQYDVVRTSSVTGQEVVETVTKYYPSASYYKSREAEGKGIPKRWGQTGVEQNYVIQHTAVNKQVGWRWGVPDIMAVIFWAMAYKEYLEDNAMLVKAYSRLAWQVKPSSAAGAQAAATQLRTPPTRDPLTGEQRNVGGTAINGLGGELSPVAATGSTVDFSKGSPLASAIASGLEVSLVVITSDPGSGNRATAETLDLPTLKAMEKRQQLHTERFLEIFEFWGAKVEGYIGVTEATEAKTERDAPKNVVVTWPQIQSDSTKDRIAALGVATELGIIFKEEARREALDVFGIAPYKPWDELPEPPEPTTTESVIPSQGNSGGVAASGGSLSTANQSRDNRDSDTGNS